MLQRLTQSLNQPYPFNAHPVRYLMVIALFALFVTTFLMIFQPFGIHRLDTENRIWVALSFGGVTFSSLLVVLVITQIFPKPFEEERWTLGKELLMGAFCFLTVGHANYLFVRFGWYSDFMMFDYRGMMIATIAVGFFPYVFVLLYDHTRRLKVNLQIANEMSNRIKPFSKEVGEEQIELKGENENERLEVVPSNIVYIASSGNYVEVVYMNGDRIKKEVMRAPLHRIENDLTAFNSFFRCHRTYLVNLHRVAKIAGNSQGYRLCFDEVSDEIPVARTKNNTFKDRMAVM